MKKKSLWPWVFLFAGLFAGWYFFNPIKEMVISWYVRLIELCKQKRPIEPIQSPAVDTAEKLSDNETQA